MGDEILLAKVLHGFLTDIPQRIEALRSYLEAGDGPGAERQAHTIKGAAANIGAGRVRAISFEMEKACEAGHLEAAKERIDALVEALDGFRKEADRETRE